MIDMMTISDGDARRLGLIPILLQGPENDDTAQSSGTRGIRTIQQGCQTSRSVRAFLASVFALLGPRRHT